MRSIGISMRGVRAKPLQLLYHKSVMAWINTLGIVHLSPCPSNGVKIPPMKRLLALAGLILAVMTASLVAQEVKHAPTFQACDADLNLWSSQIRGFPTSTREQDQESTKSLTVVEMTNRSSYLGDCSQAY